MPHPRRPPIGRRHPRPRLRAGRRDLDPRPLPRSARTRRGAHDGRRHPPRRPRREPAGGDGRLAGAEGAADPHPAARAAPGDGGGRARPPAGDADRRPRRARAAGRCSAPTTSPPCGSPLDGVPVYERPILITRDELADEMLAAMGDRRVCILRGHGITVAGESVEQATVTAVDLDELCAVTVRLAELGAHAAGDRRRRSRRAPRPRQRLQRHPPLASPRRRSGLNPPTNPPTCLLQNAPAAL